MNASALIESVQFSIPFTKSKQTVQPTNVNNCTSFKENLGPATNANTLTLHPVITSTSTEICTQPTYKEILLPKYTPYATDEYTNTATPTTVCSQINYKSQLKRISCNTMM